MSDLIALRNRVRDMLAEQEADPWLDYARAEMCEVLTDEMAALMDLEFSHELDLAMLELRKQFAPGAEPRPAAVLAWSRLLSGKQRTLRERTRLNEKARWQIAAAELMIQRSHDVIQRDLEHAKREWLKLSEAERAYLDKPSPNQNSVLDFPQMSYFPERGWAYPEPTVKRRVQMRKLRDTLEFLERDIAAQEGEA